MYDGAVLNLGGLDTTCALGKYASTWYWSTSLGTSGMFVVSEGSTYVSFSGEYTVGNSTYFGHDTTTTYTFAPISLGGGSGDWVFFTIPESTVGESYEYTDESGKEHTVTPVSAVLHLYRYNTVTQELTAMQTISTAYTGYGDGRYEFKIDDELSCGEYEFGSSYGGNSKYTYPDGSSFDGVGSDGGWTGHISETIGTAGHGTSASRSRLDHPVIFTLVQGENFIVLYDTIDWDQVAPSLCAVDDDTPLDNADNPFVSVTQSGSFFFPGASNPVTKIDTECTPVWVQIGYYEGNGYWVCDCGGIWKSQCGRWITQTAHNGSTGETTSVVFFDGKLVTRGEFLGCCANYAMVKEDGAVTLYWRLTKTVSMGGDDASFGSCCGDAAIVHVGNSAGLYLLGQRVWSKSRYGDNNAGEWYVSCCGHDYFLVQRGNFTKEKNHYHIAESETSSNNGLCTTIRKTINKGGSYGTLEDGAAASLIDVAVFEWRTKPDPLSGTYSEYHVEYPKRWKAVLHNKEGNEVEVEFDHDITYSMQGENSTPMIKEVRSGFIPWKYDYSEEGREAYVYYLLDEICKDPRISKIECFREYDTETVEGVVADGCFAVFYDDPFLNVTRSYTFNKRSGGGDALATTTDITEHFKYQPAVQDAMPIYNPDDYDFESCGCENRALINAAFPNIGLYVWIHTTCVSECSHKNDNPRSPFFGIGQTVYDNFRSKIIYISDYNCATRFDRVSEYDPVDHTIHNDYPHGTDGTGGSWLAPPTHSFQTINSLNANDGDLVDLTGRLVTSGGNVLFVWDQAYGRLEYNIVTGSKITR
jgi:hypothetical protein